MVAGCGGVCVVADFDLVDEGLGIDVAARQFGGDAG